MGHFFSKKKETNKMYVTRSLRTLRTLAQTRRYFCTQTFFAESHEWVKYNKADKTALIGVSDHAQNELGDLAHVELLNEGDTYAKGDVIATLESVKGVGDVYTPVTGTAIEFNQDLAEDPSVINSDADNTWIAKMQVSNPAELQQLMDQAKY